MSWQCEAVEEGGHVLTLNPALTTSEQRTEAVAGTQRHRLLRSMELRQLAIKINVVAGVTKSLKDDGTVGGWRDELYPVTTDFYTKPLLLMERAAAVHFGIKVTSRCPLMSHCRRLPCVGPNFQARYRRMGCTSTASCRGQRGATCGLHAAAQPSPPGLASLITSLRGGRYGASVAGCSQHGHGPRTLHVRQTSC